MPRDPLLPESSSAVRPASPDAAGGSERKRRRKVLSCYDCRRRKLQCDRAMPACGRCTKAGQAANCLYLDDNTDAPIRNSDNAELLVRGQKSDLHQGTGLGAGVGASGDLLSRLEWQDRRIKQLESALTESAQFPASGPVPNLKTSKLPLTPESITALDTGAGVNITDRETMLLRGKSFKTQFHGITHPGSLIAYIPELAQFTTEAFQRYPALARIRKEMHALEDKTDYAQSRLGPATTTDLRAALPPQPETDYLVQLYFDNYDSIYHILHIPTFREEYKTIWTDVENTRAHFIVIVLLLTACAQCLKHEEPWLYTACSSTAREKALATIRLCEDWLQTQSQKHVTVSDFQIRFLLNLAKTLNASKFKRTWTDAGTLLRFCMAAGLHRNPDLLRKPTSALDKEMRRRIWAAVAEWELQTAFGRGMMSTPWPQQSDVPPPHNIHDEDFDQSSEALPAARPVSEFTNASYLIAQNDNCMLRYTLNSVLNNIRLNIPFDEVKRYTEELESHIDALPQWNGAKGSAAPQVLLSTTLRQYMLVLHDRQFRLAASKSERDFSRMVLIETAGKIIDSHKSLLDSGCRALSFLCHDQLRAALSVCHVVGTPSDPQADSVITQIVERKATQIMDDAIEIIHDKIQRYGREQRQLWVVLAANGFMKARLEPDKKAEYMQEAVEKVTRPYYQIIACQEDAPTAATTSAEATPRALRRDDLQNGFSEYLPTGGTVGALPSTNKTMVGWNGVGDGAATTGAPNDPALLDFDEIAAWTFQDWAFDPAEFQAFNDPFQQGGLT